MRIFGYAKEHEYISKELSTSDIKLCKDCGHFAYDEGARHIRKRCLRLVGTTLVNLVTGEEGVCYDWPGFGPIPCHEERYTLDPDRCGVKGQFWKPM